MAVRFQLLGDVAARVGGADVNLGHLRQRCVLAALLVDVNVAVPADALADRVWGDRPPQRAVGTLRSYLSRLRQALVAADVDIGRRRGGYVLTADPMTVDMHRFRRLTAQARAADGDAAMTLFDQALGLWRGEPFATLDTPWLNAERNALNRQLLAAELDRNDIALRLGAHARLLDELSARAATHPLDERLAGQLILALYRCGRQADALGHYERVRVRLADELGADPSPPLLRLHRQVLVADPALSAPAGPAEAGAPGPRAGHPVPRQLPAPPRSFAGRARELAAIGAALDTGADGGGTLVITAIAGTAGIGKTWLALRWAHDNLHRFPDGQLYVNLRGFDPARGRVAPEEAVRGFLDALGVAPGAVPAAPDAQAALYRSLIADRRMLVVVDNAHDSDHALPLLPGGGASTALVTSRNQLAGLVAAHGARPLVLEALPDREARQVLTEHLGGRIAGEPEAVAVILRSCAGLPLALGVVGARAAMRPDRRLAALADELRAASTRLDALDAGELAVNVRAVLECSLAALPAGAARLFRLLGLAPGPDVSRPAAASLAALPPAEARATLGQLVAGHLVQEHVPGRYRMHDLIRLYAAEQAHAVETAAQREEAVHRVLDHYLGTLHAAATLLNPHRLPILIKPAEPGVTPEHPADVDEAMAWLKAEHAVLLAAVDLANTGGFDTHTWQLAWGLANFLERRGDWHAQVTIQRAALDATVRGGDRVGQAQAHRGLANAYALTGEYESAQAHLRRALDLFGELGDLGGQAHTRIGIGWLRGRQDQYGEALDDARAALDLFRRAGQKAGQANALNNIGWYHAKLGDFRETLTACREALTAYHALGDRFGEAEAWDSLGYAHHHLGDHGEAIACYLRALDIFRDLGGRRAEAEVLTHLGESRLAAGDVSASRDAWRRALAILEDLGHPGAAQLRSKLGR
jgi:DNA-binding SARP family transcriptional activator/Tfp pilus assembly protein PilF